MQPTTGGTLGNRIGFKRICTLYSSYRVTMNDVWRVFNCNNFFYDILRKDIKSFEHKYQIKYPDANAGNTILVTRDDLFAVIEQQQKVGNYEKVFIEAIITTENFLKDVSLIIYKDFPNKLTIGTTEQEGEKRESKLLSIIRLVATLN